MNLEPINSEKVCKSLRIIESELASILDRTTAAYVLNKARKDIETTSHGYQKYKRQTHQRLPIVDEGWGFSIKQTPLKFNRTTINDYPFRIDLTCELRWKTDDQPIKSNIAVRLWALGKEMFFRKEWDAEHLGILLSNQRVMTRFHLDLADPRQSAPLWHLQIGGIAEENEYCWLHPKIDKPRFPFMPMDLVLVCELIGATFYEQEYKKIRKSSFWKGEIQKSQEILLKEYFKRGLDAITDKKSVLTDFLWKEPQQ